MTSGIRRFYLSLGLLTGVIGLPGVLGALPLDWGTSRWRVVTSDHYDVIVPEGLEAQGQRIAGSLDALFELEQGQLGPASGFRFPVVVNPEVLGSNGSVNLAPLRSLFYQTPTPDQSGDWLAALAVHEGRHMLQFDAYNKNLVGLGTLLFGEGPLTGLAFVPRWTLEGDAVVTETVMTRFGRGRDPAFTVQTKALALEGKSYSYDKMLLGSDRDEVPNAYEFGYLMWTHIRSQYGLQAPALLLETESWLPLPVIGMELGLGRGVGHSPGVLWDQTFTRYRQFWKDQSSTQVPTPVAPLEPAPARFTRHLGLTALPDGTLAEAVYDSLNGGQIRLLGNPEEPAKKVTGGYPLQSFGAGGSWLVWDEEVRDAHFEKSRTRIVLWNPDTGERRNLSGNGRYLGPALSHDGTRIAALEWQPDYHGRLVILSTEDGRVLAHRDLEPGIFINQCSWETGDNRIVAIQQGIPGQALVRFSDDLGTVEQLTESEPGRIGQPVEANGVIYFSSAQTGTESLWALDRDGRRFLVVQRPLGVQFPIPQPGAHRIVFADYQGSMGTRVCASDLDPQAWIPVGKTSSQPEAFFAPLTPGIPGAGTFSGAPSGKTYPVRDFTPLVDGLRADAWGLTLGTDDLSGQSVPQLTLQVEDVGKVLRQTFTLGYDSLAARWGLAAENHYGGFGPDLSIRTAGGLTSADTGALYDFQTSLGVSQSWGEAVTGVGYWYVEPGVKLGASQVWGVDQGPKVPVTPTLKVSAGTGRWAWEATTEVARNLGLGTDLSRALVSSGLRTPGVLCDDVVTVTLAAETAVLDSSRTMAVPRGYPGRIGQDSLVGGLSWKIPVAYPDFAFSTLYYAKTLAAKPFTDWERGISGRIRSSSGVELTLNGDIFQVPSDFETGVRWSWLWQDQRSRWELLVAGFSLGF